MARPRTIADADVLAAAARVVGRDGPAHLTLATVGAECGLSPSTILQRFDSKRGLLLALAAHGRDDVAAVFATARAREASPAAAIVAALRDLAAPVARREELANHLAFLQLDLVDPEFSRLALDHARAIEHELAALVDAAVAAGELRAGDARATARALHVTYNGSLLTWAIDPEGTLERRLRADLEATLDARAAPDRRPELRVSGAGSATRRTDAGGGTPGGGARWHPKMA
jgi:AcrR family transcriptional regulator